MLEMNGAAKTIRDLYEQMRPDMDQLEQHIMPRFGIFLPKRFDSCDPFADLSLD